MARSYGFEEYDGPPLEPLDLYTAKSGDEIVGQLYNFVDKGDREVALRPEMTPTLARMVAARANGLKKPIRWFSIPQLFRYERQQRGRLREHFQLNCDLIGEPGPAGDAEIIALAVDIMRRLRPRTERCPGAPLRPTECSTPSWHRSALPRRVTVLPTSSSTSWVGVTRVRASGGARRGGRHVGPGGLDWRALRDVVNHVSSSRLGIPRCPRCERAARRRSSGSWMQMGLGEFVDIDLTIVRGLAYYTGPVFELFDAARSLRAICGGGRYDNLLQAVGGVDLPALGFGMGDVVLGELLRERGLAPPAPAAIDIFVAAPAAEDRPAVHALAHSLRDAGWRVEYALGSQNLGKQFKQADARGARVVLVVGEAERARAVVQLKDLVAGGQSELAVAELPAVLQSLFQGTRPPSSFPAPGTRPHG